MRPNVILSPYWDDVHPDHVAASRLIDDASFWSKLSRTDMPGEPFYPPKLYNYYSIHLRIIERPSFVIDVSETLEDKLRATACYESQFAHRARNYRRSSTTFAAVPYWAGPSAKRTANRSLHARP